MKRFFKAVGWALLYIAVYFGVSIAIGFMITIAVVIARAIGDPGIFNNKELFSNTVTDDIKELTNLILILTSLASFLVFWLIYKGRKKNIFKVCSIRKISLKGIGLIFLLGLSFNILVTCLLSYLTQLPALEKAVKSFEDIEKSITSGNIIFTVIAVVLIAPIFEEIFFRGILFNEIKNGMPLTIAFIVQAVTFGLFHGNWIQGTYAFALALLLCLVYIWYRSIWANIAFHFAFNLTAMITDKIPDRFSEGLWGISITIVSGLIAVLLVYLVYNARSKPDENENCEIESVTA